MAIAAATPGLVSCEPSAPGDDIAAVPAPTSNPMAKGTAADPDLVAPVVPWQRTLSTDELESLAVFCDVIIPADERSPSASQVGAPDFIDEWVSAPYPGNERDAVLIRGGLVWLDRESVERFGEGLRFRDLTSEQQNAIWADSGWRRPTTGCTSRSAELKMLDDDPSIINVRFAGYARCYPDLLRL